jgi:PIN like domain
MKSMFPGYYRPSDAEFKALWNDCTFMLDANVLLNVYRFPKGARDDLLKVLEAISNRLWVPNQAALEFQVNRLGVIIDQTKKFHDVRSIIDEAAATLANKLQNLQLEKRHSVIKVDEFLSDLRKLSLAFTSKLDAIENEQPDLIESDFLRDRLDALLNGKIGEPFSREALNELHKEGEERFKSERPPGFKDSHKDKKGDNLVFAANNAAVQRKYGDLVLWKQILKHTKDKQIRSVILVVDDAKEDWWWKDYANGSKKIGPRPELIHEIMSQSDVKCFYMYTTPQFLGYAGKHFDLKLREQSVTEATEIKEAQRLDDVTALTPTRQEVADFHAQIVSAVAKHIQMQLPGSVREMIARTNPGRGGEITVTKISGEIEVYRIVVIEGQPRGLGLFVSRFLRDFWADTPEHTGSGRKLVIVLAKPTSEWRRHVELTKKKIQSLIREKVIFGWIFFDDLAPNTQKYTFIPLD